MTFEQWPITPPGSAVIGDHEVPQLSHHLAGKRIALLVCGGIAAMKTPELARALRRRGAEVTAFCTEAALNFVGRQALEWASLNPLITSLTWRAEHLSDGRPFDAWLVAPATANTIAKLAAGIADTVVSAALASALGRLGQGLTQVLVAPTMHGTLHTPILERNCRALAELGVSFIPPRDAYGKHNLPDIPVLVACVCRALAVSPLRGRRLLVTGGPTPVPIDAVRRLVNRFSGRLATAIAEELLLRGAEPQLLLGEGSAPPPSWLPHRSVSSYDAYREAVLAAVSAPEKLAAAIFSAAVADYRSCRPLEGKIASGQPSLCLELEPTEKVIGRVQAVAPQLPMVTFKVLQGVSEEELLSEARRRLAQAVLVVANRAEEVRDGEQIAWLVSAAGAVRVEGKRAIAVALVDQLERLLP